MAAGDVSRSIPVQIMHTFLLFYTNCVHAILIPVRVSLCTYWCVSIKASNSTAVSWVLSVGSPSFSGADLLIILLI